MKRLFIKTALAMLCLGLVAWPQALRADERVLSFEVTAALQEDGSMVVTERIRVNIEQKIIRQGITHAFPVKELYDGRKLRHYGFELLDVKLDGKKVNYYQKTLGFHTAMAVGREGVGAPLGEHTYEITYQTTGHVRPMKDRDEIYYNVMGPGWELPVDRVDFTLELPGGAAVMETKAYTGALGETGGDYVLNGNHTVRTTRTLEPGESLTVAMAWPKGLVNMPEESLENMVGGHRTLALWGLLSITALYFIGVRLILRRAPKRVITPLFSPPQGLSPGYAASLKQKAYTGRMLHADIIWAAVNGFLRLDARNSKKILLYKDEVPVAPKRMKKGDEWARNECGELVSDLFWKTRTIDLSSEEGRDLASDTFEFLRDKYTKKQRGFWVHSYIPAVCGIFIFLILFNWIMQYIYSPMLDIGEDYGGAIGYLAIVGTMFFLIGLSVYGVIKAIRYFDGVRRLAALILSPLMGLGVLAGLWAISYNDYFFMFILTASLGLITWCAAKAPARFSQKGLDKYAQVQGLEMYIRTAEKHRLAQINAPEDTVEKFEELLPYAVALGCAEAWQKRFDRVLLAEHYVPQWLEAEGGPLSYKAAWASAAGAGLAAAARASARAAKATRSSSGSSSSSSTRSGGGSGFSGGSAGSGSGGTRVGGW